MNDRTHPVPLPAHNCDDAMHGRGSLARCDS